LSPGREIAPARTGIGSAKEGGRKETPRGGCYFSGLAIERKRLLICNAIVQGKGKEGKHFLGLVRGAMNARRVLTFSGGVIGLVKCAQKQFSKKGNSVEHGTRGLETKRASVKGKKKIVSDGHTGACKANNGEEAAEAEFSAIQPKGDGTLTERNSSGKI